MLTDEDKQWITEHLRSLEQHSDQRLGKVEERFREGLGKVEERLGKVEERFREGLGKVEERLGKVEERFAERLAKVEERFGERLEKVETTLLTEFHKWASPLEMRLRTHTAAIRALDEEMESISDRLKKVEGH
jgi:hypothetical protein